MKVAYVRIPRRVSDAVRIQHRIVHQPVPVLARGAAYQQQHGRPEVLEVVVLAVLHLGVPLHSEDGVDEHQQEQQGSDVDERGHGDDERVECALQGWALR